jgi:2-oxoisovalerate dehydrogenase E1 component
LEDAFFPQPSCIIDAIHERILPLEGHVSENDFSASEQLDRNAKGI